MIMGQNSLDIVFPEDLPIEPILQNVDSEIIQAIRKKEIDDPDVWTMKNRNRRDNMHAFFLYPAMMVPGVQKELIDVVHTCQPGVKNMYDPYMGAGSSLIAGILNGLDCLGQDINPLALLLTKVRTGTFYFEAFRKRGLAIIEGARSSKKSDFQIFENQKKWFREDVLIELGRLQEAIRAESYLPARRFFWITLAETIRQTSNDRMSTYKLHSLPLEVIETRFISPIKIFERQLRKNLEDLNSFKTRLYSLGFLSKGKFTGTIQLGLLDSTLSVLPNQTKVDLLVTSPPYGDNKTTIPYGQHSYLPLQWIDFKDIDENINSSLLKTTMEIDTQSIGGRKRRLELDLVEELFKSSPTLKNTIEKLELIGHKNKKSKVLNFYFDIDRSFSNIMKSLKVNAYLIWTIGNRYVGGLQIPNDKIMAELLISKGGVFVTEVVREIKRKKMPYKNNISSTMKEEKILILRKGGE